MKKEKKKTIELHYELNSWWNEDFDYEIDRDEAKDVIVGAYIDLIDGDRKNIDEFRKIIDELEDEELVSWDKIFNKDENKEYLKAYYESDAMVWLINNNYNETKEDYEANQADAYNDDKCLREQGE